MLSDGVGVGATAFPAGIVPLPARQAATKSFFFSPLALIASLFALYSASHSFAVLTPAEGPGASAAGTAAGAVAAPPGIVSVPARHASTKSFFFSPDDLNVHSLLALVSEHSCCPEARASVARRLLPRRMWSPDEANFLIGREFPTCSATVDGVARGAVALLRSEHNNGLDRAATFGRNGCRTWCLLSNRCLQREQKYQKCDAGERSNLPSFAVR